MNQPPSELQKRRAENQIWASAKDYSFTPDFRAYDRNGEADLYWNILFGAARRHLDYAKLEPLFAMLDRYRNAAEYEALVDFAIDLGITNGFIQESGTVSPSYIPVFDGTGILPAARR